MPKTATVATGGSGVGVVDGDHLLSLRGITKNFGPVQALQHVDLDVPAGQVTALIGDNGAGKSVLIKTISGIYPPSAGQIFWKGREVHAHTPRDSSELGIATVYQDLALCDNLDIVQNMYLGREETRFGATRRDQDGAGDQATPEGPLGLDGEVGAPTRRRRSPAVSARRSPSRARSCAIPSWSSWTSRRPLSASPRPPRCCELVRRLADRGIAVILISHNLNDVFTVADRIAVMHLGQPGEPGPHQQLRHGERRRDDHDRQRPVVSLDVAPRLELAERFSHRVDRRHEDHAPAHPDDDCRRLSRPCVTTGPTIVAGRERPRSRS